MKEPNRRDPTQRDASQVDRFLGKATPKSGDDTKELGFEAEAGSQPRMIDLVFKNGDRIGLPYAYLLKVHLSGGGKLELSFTDTTVTITGRNLGLLYQHLLAQTARRIEESLTGFDDERRESWVEGIQLAATR